MMIDVLFVYKHVILATTVLMHSITAVMNLVILHMAFSTRFLIKEHYVTKKDLVQGIDILTPKETDHTLPIMVPDMGDTSGDHSLTAILNVTGAAVSEGRHCTPHPATGAAHAVLLLMDAPHCPLCHNTSSQHSHTPSHTCNFSCRCHPCHYSMEWSGSLSRNSHHTAQETQPRKAKPLPRPSTPISPTVPRLPSLRIHLKTAPPIQTVTVIL